MRADHILSGWLARRNPVESCPMRDKPYPLSLSAPTYRLNPLNCPRLHLSGLPLTEKKLPGRIVFEEFPEGGEKCGRGRTWYCDLHFFGVRPTTPTGRRTGAGRGSGLRRTRARSAGHDFSRNGLEDVLLGEKAGRFGEGQGLSAQGLEAFDGDTSPQGIAHDIAHRLLFLPTQLFQAPAAGSRGCES